MTTHSLMNSLFRYKASIDDELMEAIGALSEKGQTENLRSALRVINHAHTVDRIFASNLQRKPHALAASWSSETPVIADLASSIRRTDQWYLDYLAAMGAGELEETVDFIFTDGGRGRMSREEMLAHVLTHNGYHRGEAGRLLPEIESVAMRDVFAGYLHRAEPQRRN